MVSIFDWQNIIGKGLRQLARMINYLAFYFFRFICPINEKIIVFESEGDFSDNAQALYSYMLKEHYFEKKYKAIWAVEQPRILREKGIKAIYKRRDRFSVKGMYYLASCKYFFYDHNNLFASIKKRSNQVAIFISHGFGVKYSQKGNIKHKSEFDFNVVLGEIPAENAVIDWGGVPEKVIQLGYPRNDYFFNTEKMVFESAKMLIDSQKYKICLMWMPTFRASDNKALSEDYLSEYTGLPLFETVSDMMKFDDWLGKNSVCIVLKLHHLQKDMLAFCERYTNIKIIRDEQLQKKGIQLYQFLPIADALITDYSSVSTDYLLLNKPIIYILDDYEQYKKHRGFSPENALDYLVGHHVYSIQDFKESINMIKEGKDIYYLERNKLCKKMHKYMDGESSKRIIDFFKI